MTSSQDWLVVAEDCEALAAAAKTQANRDMLLAAAARWRRMAKVARELDGVDLDQSPSPSRTDDGLLHPSSAKNGRPSSPPAVA